MGGIIILPTLQCTCGCGDFTQVSTPSLEATALSDDLIVRSDTNARGIRALASTLFTSFHVLWSVSSPIQGFNPKEIQDYSQHIIFLQDWRLCIYSLKTCVLATYLCIYSNYHVEEQRQNSGPISQSSLLQVILRDYNATACVNNICEIKHTTFINKARKSK